MNIAGWIVWALACLVLLTHLPLVFHRDGGVGRMAGRFAFLVLVGLIITTLGGYSKLHLLWYVPAAYCLNFAFESWRMNRVLAKLQREGFPERLLREDERIPQTDAEAKALAASLRARLEQSGREPRP